jgi:hypothetical protein
LAAAVVRTVHGQLRNPFTGELIFNGGGAPFTTESYLPELTSGPPPECPTLANFYSVNVWPLGAFEVADLGAAVGVAHSLEARDALFALPSSGWSLHQLPDLVLSALLQSPDDIRDVALRWAQAGLRRVDSQDVEDDPYHRIGDWQPVVRVLKDLCGRARLAASHVYIYQGCCVPTARVEGDRGW